MLLRGSLLAVAVALAAFAGSDDAHAQAAFTLSSPDFKDGARLAVKNAGNTKTNPNCVGENISPALSRKDARPAASAIGWPMAFRLR
jgi:phosphatidylethanolamine-binding protein (PEBP) family uncharacterized protein